MNRLLCIGLLVLAGCSGGTQRVAYPGAIKGNMVIGGYFGASSKDVFHTAEDGVVHFDGSAWTPVPGVPTRQGPMVISAGPGKLWALGGGKLERVAAGGAREDFTMQVSAEGPPLSIGRGNGEVLVSAGNVQTKRFFMYRLSGETFERIAGPVSEELTFELIRGRDDAFVRSEVPKVPFNPVDLQASASPLAYFDGTTISGPILTVGNSEQALDLRKTSPRVPKSEGVVGAFTFDGAWFHPSRRPAPGGYFYWRSDNRLGVLAGLLGEADWTPNYAVGYDPATGQYGQVLLDLNESVNVNYWIAAWDGNGWVDQQKLFTSAACVGVTCGGSRTAFGGELDDGTIVTAGNDSDEVAGIWFLSP